MSHHPVAELWVQHQGAQLVPTGAPSVAVAKKPRNDLRTWVEKSGLPPGGMMVGGLGLAGVGLALGVALPLTLATATLFGSMVTFGGGMAFLGGLKRRATKDAAALAALPPAPTSSPSVLKERSRRVVAFLGKLPEATFEDLTTGLRWTESALLETLVHMKNGGIVEEDLNLDSGQWVYRLQYATGGGVATSPQMLEQRMAEQRDRQ